MLREAAFIQQCWASLCIIDSDTYDNGMNVNRNKVGPGFNHNRKVHMLKFPAPSLLQYFKFPGQTKERCQ